MVKNYVTNAHQITEEYKKILLLAKDATVKIAPSDDCSTRLVFFEKKKRPYEFFIEDGVLTVKSTKTKWYRSLRIGIDRSKIELYVPKSMLEAVSIAANVGSVDVTAINCSGAIDIKINTGKINLEHVFCGRFESNGNTGSVTLGDFTAAESVSIKRNTGAVLLNDCKAPEIFVKTNTGKVCGKLPAGTAFSVKTKTGKIELPKAPVGEVITAGCEIKTTTGNIKFE